MQKRPVVIFLSKIAGLTRSNGVGNPASTDFEYVTVEYPERGSVSYKIDECTFQFIGDVREYDTTAIMEHLGLIVRTTS